MVCVPCSTSERHSVWVHQSEEERKSVLLGTGGHKAAKHAGASTFPHSAEYLASLEQHIIGLMESHPNNAMWPVPIFTYSAPANDSGINRTYFGLANWCTCLVLVILINLWTVSTCHTIGHCAVCTATFPHHGFPGGEEWVGGGCWNTNYKMTTMKKIMVHHLSYSLCLPAVKGIHILVVTWPFDNFFTSSLHRLNNIVFRILSTLYCAQAWVKWETPVPSAYNSTAVLRGVWFNWATSLREICPNSPATCPLEQSTPRQSTLALEHAR